MSYRWQPLSSSPARRVHSLSSRTLTRNPGFSVDFSSQNGSSSSFKRSSRSTSRGCSPAAHRAVKSVELCHSGLFNEDYKLPSMNEKEQMQGLNDRFAGYIDKVRYLEQQNKGLEAEIVELRQKQTSQSSLANIYEPELADLRNLIQDTENQKSQILLDHDHLEEDLQQLKGKCEEEARVRHDTEIRIQSYKKEQEDAQLIKLELERKSQSLMDEIVFLKKGHEEEVVDLLAQIQASLVSIDTREFAKPDLSAALREIRAQMEGFSNSNTQQAEEWYTNRVAKLNEAADINNEVLRSTRQEINEYHRQLQSKSIELETTRCRKESLEKQLNDSEERQDAEVSQYQDTIQQLENELRSAKREMAHHLREYQDLLNVKMALDVEIASYRKLLEGEETRFGSTTCDFTPSSYTYKQPQSTSPSSFVPVKTRITPQYKFVEEIVSETTKEIDMAELEDMYTKIMPGQIVPETFEDEQTKEADKEEDTSEAGKEATTEDVEQEAEAEPKEAEPEEPSEVKEDSAAEVDEQTKEEDKKEDTSEAGEGATKEDVVEKKPSESKDEQEKSEVKEESVAEAGEQAKEEDKKEDTSEAGEGAAKEDVEEAAGVESKEDKQEERSEVKVESAAEGDKQTEKEEAKKVDTSDTGKEVTKEETEEEKKAESKEGEQVEKSEVKEEPAAEGDKQTKEEGKKEDASEAGEDATKEVAEEKKEAESKEGEQEEKSEVKEEPEAGGQVTESKEEAKGEKEVEKEVVIQKEPTDSGDVAKQDQVEEISADQDKKPEESTPPPPTTTKSQEDKPDSVSEEKGKEITDGKQPEKVAEGSGDGEGTGKATAEIKGTQSDQQPKVEKEATKIDEKEAKKDKKTEESKDSDGKQ